MAFGYATGTVVGLNALWDALDTFMTGHGWSKVETVNSRDAIYKSSGTDSKVSMVFRVSVSTSPANPFKAPANAHKVFPWIFAQGYNTWTPGSPGSGTFPFGQVGPWGFAGSTVGGGTVSPDTARIHRYNASAFPVTTSPDSAYLGRTRKTKAADCFELSNWAYDGRRKIWGPSSVVSSTLLAWADIAHGETNNSSVNPYFTPGVFINNGAIPVLVHDAATDKDFIYIFNPATAILSEQFLKYDIELDKWYVLASPTWTAAQYAGGTACWDGGDFIYALRGSTSTDFARYSISTNSWTNMTAAPQNRGVAWLVGGNGNSVNIVYAPNAITGIGQDVIYVPLVNGNTTIYRYRVTDNAWDSGAGALAAQVAMAVSFFLVQDHCKYLIQGMSGTSQHWWRSDLSVAPNTWTDLGPIQSATRGYNGIQIVNPIPAKVRSHATIQTNYWFLGDADSVVVVVKINTPIPHYYWMTFGRFNSANNQAIMTTTGTTSAGNVTVNVDDTSAYHVGNTVLFWDPANATIERAIIQTIPGSTSFTTRLLNSYGTGTRIGEDPTPWMCGGNGLALCPTDQLGINDDNEPAQYVIEPTTNSPGVKRSTPSVRNAYQPTPLTLFNDDSTTTKYENRGYLQKVFSASVQGFPMLQPEGTINVSGRTYMFFSDTETSRYTVDTRGIFIGPIN